MTIFFLPLVVACGRAFEHWGHRMAVFGTDSLELSVFPAGEPVMP